MSAAGSGVNVKDWPVVFIMFLRYYVFLTFFRSAVYLLVYVLGWRWCRLSGNFPSLKIRSGCGNSAGLDIRAKVILTHVDLHDDIGKTFFNLSPPSHPPPTSPFVHLFISFSLLAQCLEFSSGNVLLSVLYIYKQKSVGLLGCIFTGQSYGILFANM